MIGYIILCAVVRVGMATEVKQNLGTLYNPLN